MEAQLVGTIGELVQFLDPSAIEGTAHLSWPPHSFALAAEILRRSGAYVRVIRDWPPADPLRRSLWTDEIQAIGTNWRRTAVDRKGRLPAPVKTWWSMVASHFAIQLVEVIEHQALCDALLQLVAAADEASVGVGLPIGKSTEYLKRAKRMLLEVDTLAQGIPVSKLRILPKQHTPPSGLTIRSLTHHLALQHGGETEARWFEIPRQGDRSLNLLLAPWPTELRPSQFQACKGTLQELAPGFGFFSYSPRGNPRALGGLIKNLIRKAKEIGGWVDGVIFPELALSEAEFWSVRDAVLREGAFLIAGVLAGRPHAKSGVRNLVVFESRFGRTPVRVVQQKHHRWRLSRSQIEMYGLGGTLDPAREWWEHTKIDQRKVHFIALNQDTTICFLLCEDLSRQDPVTELVRSVGPNLVIALLMDGPQLGVRWPARYATVLADDPGSSVLTLTSAGMVGLTRPPRGAKPSRSIGLWKDARSSEMVEIELPEGAAGVLLNLCSEAVEEWTADGRSDNKASTYPRLGGVHPIRLGRG